MVRYLVELVKMVFKKNEKLVERKKVVDMFEYNLLLILCFKNSLLDL